jgi:hypothetical protein
MAKWRAVEVIVKKSPGKMPAGRKRRPRARRGKPTARHASFSAPRRRQARRGTRAARDGNGDKGAAKGVNRRLWRGHLGTARA